MAPRKPRLFDPADLGPRVEPKRSRRRHLHAVDDAGDQLRLNRDGAGLIPGTTDGLPVRLVRPHSANKARMVSRDLGTVGRAMNRKWFEVHYLELFSGPGYLFDEETTEETPGSPIQALTIQRPFDRYVFSDFSAPCVAALRTRVASLRAENPALPRAEVLEGDANDPEHLKLLCSLIDTRALVIAYLDPAKPNLHFSTVRFLAERFRFIDFLINLPVSGIHRSLAVGGDAAPGLMLNHPNPQELLHSDRGRTAQNIRDHYDAQLRDLGLVHIARRPVRSVTTNSPLYDIVLASRKDTAVELWEKANREPKSRQLGLRLDLT